MHLSPLGMKLDPKVMQILSLPTGSSVLKAETSSRRRYGVPIGGPADADSYFWAKLLAAKPTFVCELTEGSAEFTVDQSKTVALVGGARRLFINGLERPTHRAERVTNGDRILIEAVPGRGALAYFACTSSPRIPTSLNAPVIPASGVIRVLPGPDSDPNSLQHLLDKRFLVSPRSNRMGTRLKGDLIPPLGEVVSSPTCVGTVQLTNGGELIVIGPDGPTIGGYPRIAVVITADQGGLFQRKIGEQVQFALVTLEQARLELSSMERYRKLWSNLATDRDSSNPSDSKDS